MSTTLFRPPTAQEAQRVPPLGCPHRWCVQVQSQACTPAPESAIALPAVRSTQSRPKTRHGQGCIPSLSIAVLGNSNAQREREFSDAYRFAFLILINADTAAGRMNAGSAGITATLRAVIQQHLQRAVRGDIATLAAVLQQQFQRGSATLRAGVRAP